MAEFEILESEGMRYVRIQLQEETVQAESGAMATMEGDIEMVAKIPSPLQALRSAISEQSIIRPKYTGSGVLSLEPSLNAYHVFEVAEGTTWVLEKGAYWASEGTIKLYLARERVLTSLWSGEGFVYYMAKVSGRGKVVLNAQGPVSLVTLTSDTLKVDGRLVIARTEGISYKIKRPTRSFIGSMLSGEKRTRVYEGTGCLLMSRTPYWNRRLLSAVRRR